MPTLIQILLDNPLMLLFVVAAIGYLLGHIRIAGSSLGVAAVLFVGLAFGALHPDLKLPELIYQFGLILFVYTIGISSGRHFFKALGRDGVRDTLFVVLLLLFAAAQTLVISRVLGLEPELAAGVFTGSLTNTAALAAVLEYVPTSASALPLDQRLSLPVVGYSITYPMGVVGVILALSVMRRVWNAPATEARRGTRRRIETEVVLVTRPDAGSATVAELTQRHGWDVVFGRLKHDHDLSISTGATRFAPGDVVHVVGQRADLDRVMAFLGERATEHPEFDRSVFDFRRIFVSNPAVAGRRLRDLELPQHYGAFVTRIRRGDADMLAHGDTRLELGDRVRVVATRARMDDVTAFFGDSYHALSEIDVLTFTLGVTLGLLVGMIPLPVGGGVVIKLGLAGGPLLVSLLLGAVGRTGPFLWNLPYSANLTLRQLGLILFLAGVGTRSGYAFVSTLVEGGGSVLFAAGAIITMTTTVAAVWAGHRLLGVSQGVLMGMVGGLQTQPAVLGFALEQTGDDEPNTGYANVYPMALIAKIVIAQLLVAFL
jgi:putative transport protein